MNKIWQSILVISIALNYATANVILIDSDDLSAIKKARLYRQTHIGSKKTAIDSNQFFVEQSFLDCRNKDKKSINAKLDYNQDLEIINQFNNWTGTSFNLNVWVSNFLVIFLPNTINLLMCNAMTPLQGFNSKRLKSIPTLSRNLDISSHKKRNRMQQSSKGGITIQNVIPPKGVPQKILENHKIDTSEIKDIKTTITLKSKDHLNNTFYMSTVDLLE